MSSRLFSLTLVLSLLSVEVSFAQEQEPRPSTTVFRDSIVAATEAVLTGLESICRTTTITVHDICSMLSGTATPESLTEDFYPFLPGSKRWIEFIYSPGDTTPWRFQYELTHKQDGTIHIEKVSIRKNYNNNTTIRQQLSPETQYYRQQNGYIDIGIADADEIHWSPIVKLSATPGDRWERRFSNGERELYHLRHFRILEVSHDIVPSGEVLCAILEKTTLKGGDESSFEVITLARHLGPIKRIEWRHENGERQQRSTDTLTAVSKPSNQNRPAVVQAPPADSSVLDVSLANGSLPAATLIKYLERVQGLHIHTSDDGADVVGTAFEVFNNVSKDSCRIHVGKRERLGQSVSVGIVQNSKKQLVAVIAGTPFNINKPIRYGNDITSLDSFLSSLLPEVSLRTMFKEHAARLALGGDAAETFGKASLTVTYNKTKGEVQTVIIVAP